MSKYANLPDIDTDAPDVYETEDVFVPPTSKGDSSDDEQPGRGATATGGARGKNAPPAPAGSEELDASSGMSAEEAARRFRKAERRRDTRRARTVYADPPSPSSASPTRSGSVPVPAAQRLRLLQAELTALESELADPLRPAAAGEEEDAGELIRGLVDVRGRLERLREGREGRGRLVSVVLGETALPRARKVDDSDESESEDDGDAEEDGKGKKKDATKVKDKEHGGTEVRSISEMDKRVGQLETLIGSSSATLDETSPLPPPLLPQLARLSAQLTLLTQPRHIDSISRRLKLLLSDLERAAHQQHQATHPSAGAAHGKKGAAHAVPTTPTTPAQSGPPAPASASPLSEQLAPILTRLAPLLPHIPHLVLRLRTLSSLHASAGSFASTLAGLEAEQAAARTALAELAAAADAVEKGLEENRKVVGANVKGLEERVRVVVEKVSSMEQ